MAFLNRFSSLSLLSSYNNNNNSSLEHHQHPFTWTNQKLTISASSTNNSRLISAKADDGKKKKKKVKSNADLCTELRQFVSMAGLPEGHVPSFKDLSHHGRTDLAHIVRRRGYRFITQLLTQQHTHDAPPTTSFKYQSLGQDQQLSQSTHASGTNKSFLEKASNFVKDGELDNIQDDDLTIGHKTSSTSGVDKEIELGSSGRQGSNIEANGNSFTSVVNARALTSKLVPPPEIHSDDFLSAEGVPYVLPQKGLEIQTTSMANEDEVDHLKAMLRQKELELYQLKEQIEKEKLALSTLQAKAENEIGKAQKIMSSKDEELHIAEESLSGLKEVQIEYWGHGETVEVAGSFNGWHHRIKMNLSTSVRSAELRKSRVWSTVLWLYPGIYEIKFVVDNHWMIDPRRESVTKGTLHNNILRVDR